MSDKKTDPVGQTDSVSQTTDPVDHPRTPVDDGANTVGYDTYKKTVDELKDVKGKLKKLTEDIEAQNQKTLKENNQFKELYETEQKKSTAKDEKLKDKEIKILIQKHGLQDLEYSEILKSKIQFDDEFNATNADDVFKTLKEEKPFLFGESTAKQVPGTETRKAYSPKGHIYTRQEIQGMSIEEYKKHRDEIKSQEAAGLVN